MALLSVLGFTVCVWAQQRPLHTEDTDMLKQGYIRAETGFEFLKDMKFPLSGLQGDLTRMADTKLSIGLAPNVEFQIEWTPYTSLAIKKRNTSYIDLKFGQNESHTSDVGDATLWTKIKLLDESKGHPAFGFRLGVQLPNTDQSRGIGTNTTNVFGVVNIGKKFANHRLSVFGNIGIGIMQAPLVQFTQNDVLLYGAAFTFKVSKVLSLYGEANGAHSTRKKAPVGTEDISTARAGLQIKAAGLNWYAAAVIGLSDTAPKRGIAIGLRFDWHAF